MREHAAFRLLFWGQALSVVGDRITPVAIAFAVLGLGSATDLGLVMAAGGIPFASSPWRAECGPTTSAGAGSCSPRTSSARSRRPPPRCYCSAATPRCGCSRCSSFVYGTAAAVFMPALIGLIPQTVGHERLQEANGLLALTRSVAGIAGPALAGVIIVASGTGEAIAFDAATFAVSALCLARMGPVAEPAAAAGGAG